MSKKPTGKRPSAGIPRTFAASQKLGYEVVALDFSQQSDAFKEGFVHLAETGARANSICGIAPVPNDPRVWLVCYKDASKRCTWVRVPRDRPCRIMPRALLR